MREKELRLALVCYGGISLAIYMHGITKEIWHLVGASRAFLDDNPKTTGIEGVYRQILEDFRTDHGIQLRVLADIIAGASAGGINGIFLAQAIETGQSLEPLTDLWLTNADVDRLLDPDARPVTRFSKFWAAPLVWMAARHPGDAVERTVAPATREEVRRKLSNFIRSRWFEPPFGGPGFTDLLFDALDAMQAGKAGPPLLPPGHPLDLFVTVTDFGGHPETLKLNSPPIVIETEHRLTIGFCATGRDNRSLADPAELVFAARATASFPGAFPPFTVRELDDALTRRQRKWPGRGLFLQRILPRQWAAGTANQAVLIDGSVLANAPFAPAIAALKNRPSRREVDRRFVYIDPKPRMKAIRFDRKGGQTDEDEGRVPGFIRTIFGALSDIPREQPIRDNLETIEARSRRIARMRQIIETLRPEIDSSVERAIGGTFFLDKPTPARLAGWRAKAQEQAARDAGFAYPAYGQLKLAGIVDDLADSLFELALDEDGTPRAGSREAYRAALWSHVHDEGLDHIAREANRGAAEQVITFFRAHDMGFRVRRLRFLARRLTATLEGEQVDEADEAATTAIHDAIYGCLALYAASETAEGRTPAAIGAARGCLADPANALAQIADERDLRTRDAEADALLADALAGLPRGPRRVMLLAYLGFPYYDIATLPLLQGDGLDEYDPVKVDRIAPDDATAIRSGGPAATLKGIEFNSFGAFFSRVYRENDYLWGRLHGADRLIDILCSTLPADKAMHDEAKAGHKRRAFHAILDEEEGRLTLVQDLIDSLRREIG